MAITSIETRRAIFDNLKCLKICDDQERPTTPPSAPSSDEQEERGEAGSPSGTSGRCPHCTIHRDHDSTGHTEYFGATSYQMYKLRKDASIRFKSKSDVLPFYSPIFYPAPSECLPVAQIEVNSLVSGAREPLSCAGASETEVIPSAQPFIIS